MLRDQTTKYRSARAVVLVALACVAALTVNPVPAAAGDEVDPCGAFGICGDPSGDSTSEGTDGSGGSQPPVDYEYYFDDDGEGVGAEAGYEDDGCWGVRAVPQGQGTTYGEAVDAQNAQGENDVLWGNCRLEDTIDVDAIVRAAWERQVRPPPPSPLEVAPGRMYVGLTAYLEIGGERVVTFIVGTPLGAATITATARYEVHWGDGGSPYRTTDRGVPYPGGPGEITYLYETDGGRTITVNAFWTGRWAMPGQPGGALPELPTPTTANLDLPVYERQPVTN